MRLSRVFNGIGGSVEKADGLQSQVRLLRDQVTVVRKRMNLMESAWESNGGDAGAVDPEALGRLQAAVERIDSSLKSVLRRTMQLADMFKDAQCRHEEELRSHSERLARLEDSIGEDMRRPPSPYPWRAAARSDHG